jgi:hypothetical protein
MLSKRWTCSNQPRYIVPNSSPASLSDDPSGIWYLDVSCKTEHNGQTGTVTGHIPLCLDLKESPDGGLEAALSVMDDTPDEPEEGQDNILTFKPKGK